MESVVKILQDAREDGMSIKFIDENNLQINGPATAKKWIPVLKEHKEEIIKIVKNESIYYERIEKIKSRLRKGHTYFMGVDDKIFKIADKDELSTLEARMLKHLDTWLEIEAEELRELYEYEGCIYNDSKCPPLSRVPVRCTYCYENSLAESAT